GHLASAGPRLGRPGRFLACPASPTPPPPPPAPQPVDPRLPVPPGPPHPSRGPLPARQPVRQCQHLPLRGPEHPGLGHPPRRIPIRRPPDCRRHARLTDVDATHPAPVQRLVGHLFQRPSPIQACYPASGYRPGNRGRAERLTRVLEATINGP